MSNSFDFLPKEQFRIRSPRVSLIIFLASALLFSFLLVVIRLNTKRLQQEFKTASESAQNDSMRFVEEARQMLPQPMIVNDLKLLTEEHNNAIGGERSQWTRLFNALEEALPKTAAIISIKNPNGSNSVFAAEDRQFRLSVAVPDMETANSFYMKISENKVFDSLSFNPSRNQNSNRFILIEISFRFNEKNAET